MLKPGQDIIHPDCDFGDLNKLEFGDLDPENKYIISTRIRVARNLDGFPFGPIMTNEVSKNGQNIIFKKTVKPAQKNTSKKRTPFSGPTTVLFLQVWL